MLKKHVARLIYSIVQKANTQKKKQTAGHEKQEKQVNVGKFVHLHVAAVCVEIYLRLTSCSGDGVAGEVLVKPGEG